MNRILISLLLILAVVGTIYMNFNSNESRSMPNTNPVNGSNMENSSKDQQASLEKNSDDSVSKTVAAPEKGSLAPHFELPGLNGSAYSLKELDKPVVINFWASWCGPCKAEAPELVRLYKKYKDEVEIYAVNLTSSDNMDAIEKFAKDYEFTFPVLLDKKGEVASKYKIRVIPTTYFVDEEGVIVEKVIGLLSPEKLEGLFKDLAEHK